MSTRFKINYNDWSDEGSPIKDDVKIKISHNKLTAQTNNSLEAKEWRKKNPEKASKNSAKGGNKIGKTKEGRARMSKVGTKYGPENAVKFIPIETKQKNGKKFGKQNLCNEVICEKCGRLVNKGNYAQSHGKKCKELDKIKLLNLLPDKFTKAMIKEIAEEHRIKNWNSLNLLHHSCPYTKCIIKVDKPNQYNPSWYGKNKREINKMKK